MANAECSGELLVRRGVAVWLRVSVVQAVFATLLAVWCASSGSQGECVRVW